jgi:chromosome segregation ATPase
MPTDLFADAQGAVTRWKKRATKAEKEVRQLEQSLGLQCERARQLEARCAGLESELKDARARLGERCDGRPAYVWTGPHLTKQRAEQVYRRLMRQRDAERARLVPVLRSLVQELDGGRASSASSTPANWRYPSTR